jgi:hypothetical protein
MIEDASLRKAFMDAPGENIVPKKKTMIERYGRVFLALLKGSYSGGKTRRQRRQTKQ